MTYYLPSDSQVERERTAPIALPDCPASGDIADLRVFWGPEFYRLEYLVHLIETGRVKDQYSPQVS